MVSGARRQHEKAVFQRGRGVLFLRAVVHDDPDHEAKPAHFVYGGGVQRADGIHEMRAFFADIGQKTVAADRGHHNVRTCSAHRVAAEGGAMVGRTKCAGTCFAREDRADRQAAAESFSERDDVGRDSVGFAREKMPRAPHTRLHLVDDKQNVVFAAQARRLSDKFF